MSSRPLNPRQIRFAEEYVIDFNATAAYQRAGYTATGESGRSVCFEAAKRC